MRFLIGGTFLFTALLAGCMAHRQPPPPEKSWSAEYLDWPQVMDFHPSVTHWEQDIRSFVNTQQGFDMFQHNYAMEQLELDGADEDEIEEEGGYQLYPAGIVIAKENFEVSPGGERILDTISFMAKKDDGTWRYYHVKADGEVLVDSDTDPGLAEQECGLCHAEVDYRDYIYHTFYDDM